MSTSPDTFRHHLKTHYFYPAGLTTHSAPSSCASDSASADHCARIQIIFTWGYSIIETGFELTMKPVSVLLGKFNGLLAVKTNVNKQQ